MNRRRLNTKRHLAVDAYGIPVRVIITEGTVADCTQTHRLVEGIDAAILLADKGYDSDAFAGHLPGYSALQGTQSSARLRQILVPLAASGRKGLLGIEALARRCHTICQEHIVILGGCPYSLYPYLEKN